MQRFRIILLLLFVHSACLMAKTPQLTAFLADSASNTGTAVIVCPGGSYSWLDMKTEGVGVAEWLQSQGINAFVLKYHVATVSAYIIGYPKEPSADEIQKFVAEQIALLRRS